MTFVLGSEHGITCASRVCSQCVVVWGVVREAVRQPVGGPSALSPPPPPPRKPSL